MNKSYSILILPENETRVRRLGITHHTIRALLCVAVVLMGVGAWIFGDYLWMKFRSIKENNVRAQLTAEVETLKTKRDEEVTLLRDQVLKQQKNLLTLQDQIESSQKLLANWKERRAKFAVSLPRSHRTALKGQHVVDNLEIHKLTSY